MSQKKKKQIPVPTRLDELDLIKAMGIIFMVAVHANMPWMRSIRLFHMAIFFMASGFFFKSSSSDNFKSVWNFIWKKIKQLWVPYFIWNAIFTCCNNLFIRCNIYTDNPNLSKYTSGEYIAPQSYMGFMDMGKNIAKGFVFLGGTQIGGVFWFLKVLFGVSVGYCIVDFVTRKIAPKKAVFLQALVAGLLLAAGYYCSLRRWDFYGVEQVATCYWMYFAGVLFGEFKEKYVNRKWGTYVVTFGISLGILWYLSGIGTVSLGKNAYGDPVFLIAASVAGFICLFSTAHFLKQIPGVKSILCLVGQRTMPIMILHFLCMKIVAFAVTKYYGIPLFCMAAFPNLYGHIGAWWLAYTVVGVSIPLILDEMYRKTKKFLPNITK